MDPRQSGTLAAIDHAIRLCEQQLEEQADTAVAYMLQEMKIIKDEVNQAWPLSAELKQQINLGPFAAKNIDDWNQHLARALMTIHYALQNDGAGIERLGF